jgi:hypothetical protein
VHGRWVIFDGLAGSENVTGFIQAHDSALDTMTLTSSLVVMLPGLEPLKILLRRNSSSMTLGAAAQTGLQNVNFSTIAQEVGGLSNPWLVTKTYLDTVAKQCIDIMNNKWKDTLGGIDEFLFDNCNAMIRSLRVD